MNEFITYYSLAVAEELMWVWKEPQGCSAGCFLKRNKRLDSQPLTDINTSAAEVSVSDG